MSSVGKLLCFSMFIVADIMNNKNKTVVRSMDIVNLFIDHTELSFQEIIDLSGIPKTSVYPNVNVFRRNGVSREGD